MYLYLTGRGHSGSTIVDILLGNSSQIESVGELLAGLSRAEREPCSCGAAMSDCGFWREVRSRVEAEGIPWNEVCRIADTDVAGRIADAGAAGLWRIWRAGRADPAMAHQARIMRALARAIAAITGKPNLLYSSKTPGHGLLLLRYLPEARLIHLVRDPRDVLRSYVWRVRAGTDLNPDKLALAERSAPLFLAYMAASWTVVNLVCDVMGRAFPGRVVRMRFEDLCARPASELDRIGRVLGVDLSDLSSKAAGQEPLVVGHNIGGNHCVMRVRCGSTAGGGRAAAAAVAALAHFDFVLG
jgi:Sulfotransferase family